MKIIYTVYENDWPEHNETIKEVLEYENRILLKKQRERDIVSDLCFRNNWKNCETVFEILEAFPLCPTYEDEANSLRINFVKEWVLEHHREDVIVVEDEYSQHESLIVKTYQ